MIAREPLARGFALRRLPKTLYFILGFALLAGCAQPNEYQPPPPPNVTVARPVVQTVTSYLEETGTTEPEQRVEIRARVSGILEEIRFTDGQDVKKGQLLYVIQKGEYQASLAQAEADLAAAAVEVERARTEQERQQRLFDENATPERNLVLAQAEYKNALAVRDAKQAICDRAKLDVEYCEIRSPFDGRVERTLVKLGNLVGDGEATHLTTIVNYNPIQVYFSISERALLQVSRRPDAAGEKPDITSFAVYLRRAIDKDFPFKGHLDYADLGVDQSTGTFKIRARFDNPTLEIFPGLFVRVRLPVGTVEDAILIPERAVGFDQVGRFVMIVVDGNVVERRNVELGDKHEHMVVIESGLDGSERVIIDGIQRARPGEPVTPNDIELEPVRESTEMEVAEGEVASPESAASSSSPAENAGETGPGQ